MSHLCDWFSIAHLSYFACTMPTIPVLCLLCLYYAYYACTMPTMPVLYLLCLYYAYYACTMPTMPVLCLLCLYYAYYACTMLTMPVLCLLCLFITTGCSIIRTNYLSEPPLVLISSDNRCSTVLAKTTLGNSNSLFFIY